MKSLVISTRRYPHLYMAIPSGIRWDMYLMTESIKQKVKQPSVFLMVKYDRIDVCIDRYEMLKWRTCYMGGLGYMKKQIFGLITGVLLMLSLFGCGKIRYNIDFDGYGFKSVIRSIFFRGLSLIETDLFLCVNSWKYTLYWTFILIVWVGLSLYVRFWFKRTIMLYELLCYKCLKIELFSYYKWVCLYVIIGGYRC